MDKIRLIICIILRLSRNVLWLKWRRPKTASCCNGTVQKNKSRKTRVELVNGRKKTVEKGHVEQFCFKLAPECCYLVLYCVVVLFLLGLRLFKLDRDEIWQECASSKYPTWRHFTQKTAATCWVKTKRPPSAYAAAFRQFLIYSAFVLVIFIPSGAVYPSSS